MRAFNPEDEEQEVEFTRGQLGRLLDLEEIARRTLTHGPVTSEEFATRIHRVGQDTETFRWTAEKTLSRVLSVAKSLGHEVYMAPDPNDELGRYVVTFADVGGLLEDVAREIDRLTLEEADPEETKRLEATAKRLYLASETPEQRERRLREYNAKWRRSLRDRDICMQCTKSKARPGSVFCKPCAEKHSQKMLDRYYIRKKSDLCVVCGQPKDGGDLTVCERCAKVRSAIDRKSYLAHVESRRARGLRGKTEAREKGFCLVCKKRPAIPGREKCEECKTRRAKQRAELIGQGICPECKKRPAVEGATLCLDCKKRSLEKKEAYRERQRRRLA